MVYQQVNMPREHGHDKKNGFSRFRPLILNDWPCVLLIVIANSTRNANWIHLKSKGISVDIIGILGMRTSSSLKFPLSIVAWITLTISFFITKCVPLHSFGWFRFWSIMTTEPTFSSKLCGGKPGTPKEFKNSDE